MQWVKKRLLVIVSAILLGLAVATPFSALQGEPVSAAPSSIGSPISSERSCAVEWVGWLVCPVVSFFSKIGDMAFSMLANMFLETEPELVANNSGTKIAWDQARNLANILFIIAFLVIVFSQVTGFGITNYGIKRMLPRLIVAALAVNVSYWICQAMVDLSNIAGWAIKDFLTNTAYGISNQAAMPVHTGAVDFKTNAGVASKVGGGLEILATMALASIAVYFFLPALLSAALVVVISCILIILTLLLRKAIIVLLVVLSPIAFVMYLLPNTEKLFSKWLKMFWQLLMVFPVVALLLGGGQLASAIVLAAGSNGDTGVYQSSTNKCVSFPDANKPVGPNNQAVIADCNNKGAPIMLGITAALIAVAPLLAVYPVLQGALAATGSLGGKIQALGKMASNPSRRRLKEDAEFARIKRRREALQGKGVMRIGGIIRGGERRRAVMDSEKSRYNKARVRYTAENAVDGDGELTAYGRKLAGGTGPGGWRASRANIEQTKADAESALRALEEEDKKAQKIKVDSLDFDKFKAEIDGLDPSQDSVLDGPRTAALIERAFEVGTEDMKQALIDTLGKSGRESFASRTLAASMQANNPGFYSGSDIDGVAKGKSAVTRVQMIASAVAKGQFSPTKMAGASPDEILSAERAVAGDTNLTRKLQDTAKAILGNDQLKISLGKNEEEIKRLGGGGGSSSSSGGSAPPSSGGSIGMMAGNGGGGTA